MFTPAKIVIFYVPNAEYEAEFATSCPSKKLKQGLYNVVRF